MRAVWFGQDVPDLFGWVHTPAEDSAPGVVLCPPLGRDGASAHYTYRQLAMDLAEAGLIAVRFDYDSTGDSAGDGWGTGRSEAWLASIDAAVALARDSGATSISLVGLRMGALLAEHAAERIPGLRALVLWDPSVSGRSFVRGQRALEMLRAVESVTTHDGVGQTTHHSIPWLAMSPEGLTELTSLTAPEEARRAPVPTLLLHRPNDSSSERVRSRLSGQPVETVEVEGQHELLDVDPVMNQVPRATVALVVQWLTATLRADESTSAADDVGATQSVAGSVVVGDVAVVQPESAHGAVMESVLRLGPAGLFGIETFAEGVDRTLPTIVFLNSGNIWHVSPGRLWVRMARAWAGLGFRCVRFDLSSLGDSAPRPGQGEQVALGPEAFQDIEEAAHAISPGDPSDIVFVGLSSGGYHALELGLRLSPRAVCVINPIIAFTPPEKLTGGRMDPRRRVCVPKTKMQTVAGQRIRNPVILRPLVRLLWLLRSLRYRDRMQTAWLGKLVRSGVLVYGICAPAEAMEFLGAPGSALDELTADPHLRVDVIEGLEHALVPQDHQAMVAEKLTDYLTDQFLSGGAAESPAAVASLEDATAE